MPSHQVPVEGGVVKRTSRRQLVEKVLRYAAGSVVATVCSEATFLLLYGPARSTPAVASALGWLAGAVPNYWLNRTWTWRRRGRPSLLKEVLPYVAIVVVTLVLAVVATSLVDRALKETTVSHPVRTVLVGGTFLGVYGVVFVLRFYLLDRLFRGAAGTPSAVSAVSAKEPV
jgi:putative flippase GtrA